MNKGVNVIKFPIMRWGSVFLAVYLLWDLCSAQPFPYLKLIESVSWDSSFSTRFAPEQKKEIEKISESLNPAKKRNIVWSPNGKFKMEYKAYSIWQKDDLTVEAVYYDSTGEKLWEDTLSFIPEISNNGEWMYGSDNEGCGMIFVAKAAPLFRITKVIEECFDQKQISPDGQFIAAVTTPGIEREISDLIVVFGADGTELWSRNIRHGNKMVTISKDSRYVVAASLLFEGEIKDYYTALHFFNRDGKLLGERLVAYEQLHIPPVLRTLSLSPDGEITFAIFSGAIAAFETKTGKRKWTHYYPNVYWDVSELIFIPGTDLAIISVHDSTPGRQKRYLDLLDLRNKKQENNFVVVGDIPVFNMRLMAVPTEDKVYKLYLIGGDQFQKHLIQLFIPR